MLDQAKHFLEEILQSLAPYLEREVPLVGLEPSCISVFRDELLQLFPERPEAQKLAQRSFLLSEFIQKYSGNVHLPQLSGTAIVQGHCHHKTVLGIRSEEELLRRTGIETRILDSGCCGMAGAFGFEEEHHEISRQIGERVLLPEVRKASQDTRILANGFSCREQIRHFTGRRAGHIAEILHEAVFASSGASVYNPVSAKEKK
jgi:Fe-S oxidoreductase